MTGLLADRVAMYLSEHPNRSVREIAGDLRARESTVRTILGSSGLFCQHDGPGKAVTYTLGLTPGEPGPSGPTHKQKVLALLSDGKPHSHMEGYRLGVMLHSRIADLRRDGHRILCDKSGGNYTYTLVLESGQSAACPDSSACDPSGLTADAGAPKRGGLGDLSGGAQAAANPDGQLTLTGSEFRKQAAA